MNHPKPLRDPLAVTVQEAKRLTGLSHVTLYKLMKEGRLTHTKVGRRTLVGYASLRDLTTPSRTYVSKLNNGLQGRTAAKRQQA